MSAGFEVDDRAENLGYLEEIDFSLGEMRDAYKRVVKAVNALGVPAPLVEALHSLSDSLCDAEVLAQQALEDERSALT